MNAISTTSTEPGQQKTNKIFALYLSRLSLHYRRFRDENFGPRFNFHSAQHCAQGPACRPPQYVCRPPHVPRSIRWWLRRRRRLGHRPRDQEGGRQVQGAGGQEGQGQMIKDNSIWFNPSCQLRASQLQARTSQACAPLWRSPARPGLKNGAEITYQYAGFHISRWNPNIDMYISICV